MMLMMLKKLSLSPRYATSLQISWKEGVAASIMMMITDYYLIPLGLLLGASALEIGLSVAIPQLLASVAQLLAAKFVAILGSRLRFVVRGVYFQAAILVPIAFLPFLDIPHRIGVFIFLITLFRIVGNLVGTVWGSVVSDYLPPEERGRYFGWRAQITGFTGLAGLVLGGVLLYALKRFSPSFGFFVLFGVTAAARFISGYLMSRMEDVPVTHAEPSFSFDQFWLRIRESNFAKFVLFISSLTLGTFIAAPYFSVFMLRDLHFSYLEYMLVNLSSVVAGIIGFPLWGKHADHVGNVRILRLTSMLLPVVPVLWLFSKNLFWLIGIEAFSGFIWSGFALCAVNFIFDSVPQEKRVRFISYTNLFIGLSICIGAGLGGLIADKLPPLFGYRLYFLFTLSALARGCSYFFLSQRFAEIRENTRKVKSANLFFSVVGIKSILGRGSEISTLPLGHLDKGPS